MSEQSDTAAAKQAEAELRKQEQGDKVAAEQELRKQEQGDKRS